ncbi:MAG: endonuclease III [Candidatus Thorarchaeota archaeon]|nr:MAG: endonuclease III [Candidatus Thorarchaeota archaeon]
MISEYGSVVAERKLPPIDELVMTILSQNTSDVNMLRGFESLKTRFPTWEEVLAAPEELLADTIRSSGTFRVKAKRIKASLSEIVSRVGSLDLSLLEDMELEAARDWLTSLHGVGPKTAAIVLLFSFGRPVLPVDTHVWRVTKRIGLVSNSSTREKAQIELEQIVPGSCVYSINHNLIKHGREICRAQKPNCSSCFLKHECEYYTSL